MQLLYKSQYFTSYQPEKGRYFCFDFNQKLVNLSFCQLLAFREKVKNIDLETHFNGDNKHGIEIISLCNREHLFVFNTIEVIDLKEFIQGTFAMGELNSLVQ